jgi:hypothetical protein
MNKDLLTVLGCSGSIAFVLVTNNAAQAENVSPMQVGNVDATPTMEQRVNTSASPDYPQSSMPQLSDGLIKEPVILNSACCALCQSIQRAQMEQTRDIETR